MPNDPTEAIKANFDLLAGELSKRIVGHSSLIRHMYICLLCGGHALIEGLPGLGKTLTVKTFSRALDLAYSRIQFTPDLMPADILGTNIVNVDEKGRRFFEFYKGPVFGQVILADEINRASPKTQSALLEAMQEQRVTLYGKGYQLDPPFMVLATQNPIEMEGTYPLPEAQIDRFFFKLKVSYPDSDELVDIIDRTTADEAEPVAHVLDAETILGMQLLARQVPIAEHVKRYAVRLVEASHPGNRGAIDKIRKYVRFGASPRGAQTLVMAAKINALLSGRSNASRDDIRTIAKPALRHRIMLNLRGAAEGVDPDEIVNDLVGFTQGKK
ncbi:MAG: MoxR family ATPase [Desulfobacteraceae bacterium]|nr:MoxR family ATPase [Desulfobacteraceae bacterium]